MNDNAHEVLSGFVGLLLVTGIIIMVPSFPALLYSEYLVLPFFLLPGIIAISFGLYLGIKYPLVEEFSIRGTIIIACAGWLFISAIGAIPFLGIGMPPLDAFFESISGFTTTGMTLIAGLETCPRSILFWRSLSEWVGGVGVILLFTILLRGGMSTWRLYTLEGREKFTPSVKSSVRNILLIYLSLTTICAIVLYFCGLDAFDSINHAMTALATGGFSTRTGSITDFDVSVKIALMIFMILGATSFVLFYNLIKFEVRKVIGDVEFKTMLLMIFLGGLVASVSLLVFQNSPPMGFVDGFFNVVSIVTTTGYTSGDISAWPNLTKVLLLIFMILGGSAGSTAGGIKLWRGIVLFRLVKREVQKLTLPHSAVIPIKIGGKTLDDEYVMKIVALFTAYVLFLFVEFLLLSLSVPDLFGAFSLAVSSLSNIGPAFYPVDLLDPFSKIVLIFGMWFGRLELLPVMAFILKELPLTFKEYIKGKAE
ncbi:MAG: TrkH family potassium uptake protein [Candidatus Methanomethyliaceae archaeon]